MFKDRPWIYDHDEPLSRYSLGQHGEHPFVCFGINPSTAKPNNLDPTVASVARFAVDHGYDGWLMFNVYPQRATNPNEMHAECDQNLHIKNVEVIKDRISGYQHPLDIWCAWGTLIEKRGYLKNCLTDIAAALPGTTCRFLSRGNISKAGHPHHPLYLKKSAPLDIFNLQTYVAGL
ncbi:MAG: DUF1643 domain-containing protein [Bacteroidota bacterium]